MKEFLIKFYKHFNKSELNEELVITTLKKLGSNIPKDLYDLKRPSGHDYGTIRRGN
jgi:hypothetical protein